MKYVVALACLLGVGLLATPAQAGVGVNVGVGVPLDAPAPVYAPPPAYYAAPPVYPAPGVCTPRAGTGVCGDRVQYVYGRESVLRPLGLGLPRRPLASVNRCVF